MKKLILVRAGSTAWEEEHRIQGRVPLPLSAAGKRDLDAVVEQLRRAAPDALYSSGNESAGPTAEYLSQRCRLKGRKIADLHELDCGLWQGLREEDLKRRFGRAYRQWRNDPTSVVPPQGEPVQEAFSRVEQVLGELDKKNRDKTVVLVAAPIVAALIACALTAGRLEELWRIAEDPVPVRVFDFEAVAGGSGQGAGVRCLTEQVTPAPTDAAAGDGVEVKPI